MDFNLIKPRWIIENFSKANADIYSIIYNATNGKRGYCDCSINFFAEATGANKRTAQRRLKELEDSFAIERIGFNSYRNVKYRALINEDNVVEIMESKRTKCLVVESKRTDEQKDKVSSSKGQSVHVQKDKVSSSKGQSVHVQKDKVSSHKNKRLIKENIKDIYSPAEPNNLPCTAQKDVQENSKRNGGQMQYKNLNEDSYNKSFDGWWKHYIFFEDDEELNDLFIKFLDKTAEENNNYKDGCSIPFDLIQIARTTRKYSDDEICNMSDEDFEKIPEEDLKPLDVTQKLKAALREFGYNNNKNDLSKFLKI